MENSPLQNAIEISTKKVKNLNNSPLQFFTKAGLAGTYIGFAVIFAFRLGDAFYQAGSPVTSLIAGMAFSLALLTIVIGGVELFTGNAMYATMGVLAKQSTIKDLIRVWIATYFGNLAGILFFTVLFLGTGLFDSIQPDHYLLAAVEGKMNLTLSEMFFRGILCNWLVCLAIWIPMQTKDFTAKVMLIMIIVSAFFVSGYEHSIANMALFSIALSVPHPETITFAGAIINLLVVTVGNIIGGGVFVGAAYIYINRDVNKKEKMGVTKTADRITEKKAI